MKVISYCYADNQSFDTPQPRREGARRGSQKGRTNEDDAGPSSKKKRDPNWSKGEILALIEAKRQEYINEMNVEDVRELICPEVGKWGKIAIILKSSKREGDVGRDHESCEYKWSTLLSIFKKIWDFHSHIRRNSEEYFKDTTLEEKKQHKLPKSFYIVAYRNMAEWMKNKAIMTLAHAQDTMDSNDSKYQAPVPGEGAHVMDDLDIMREEAWHHGTGVAASTIDLTAGESPGVSSAQSHGGVVKNSEVGALPTVLT